MEGEQEREPLAGRRPHRAYDRLTGALATGTVGPDRTVRAACALGTASAGVISGERSGDNRALILGAAQAALHAGVPTT